MSYPAEAVSLDTTVRTLIDMIAKEHPNDEEWNKAFAKWRETGVTRVAFREVDGLPTIHLLPKGWSI